MKERNRPEGSHSNVTFVVQDFKQKHIQKHILVEFIKERNHSSVNIVKLAFLKMAI